MKRPSFEQAKAQYVHRFTMEHGAAPNGQYYAPQFASDQEWYDHTQFPLPDIRPDMAVRPVVGSAL
jgi:hypothetical protein